MKRLGAILYDLLNITPDDKRESLEFQLKLLEEVVEKNFENEYLKKLALEPAFRGTGF